MKLVFTILTILLAAVYLFVGVNKLTPLVHKETHEMLVENSLKWQTIWKVPADTLLFSIGVVETVCALLLFVPGLDVVANGVLFVTMIGAVITHFTLQEPPHTPAVLAVLLLVRLFIHSPVPKKRDQKKSQ